MAGNLNPNAATTTGSEFAYGYDPLVYEYEYEYVYGTEAPGRYGLRLDLRNPPPGPAFQGSGLP